MSRATRYATASKSTACDRSPRLPLGKVFPTTDTTTTGVRWIANAVKWLFSLATGIGMSCACDSAQDVIGKGRTDMPIKREKTRIAVLIVVAVLAIAFAMLEALADEPRTVAPAKAGEVSEGDAPLQS